MLEYDSRFRVCLATDAVRQPLCLPSKRRRTFVVGIEGHLADSNLEQTLWKVLDRTILWKATELQLFEIQAIKRRDCEFDAMKCQRC